MKLTKYILILLSLFLIFSCDYLNGPDLIPPTVSIQSPLSDQLVSELVPIIVLTEDDEGITKVEFFIDDSLYFTDTESPYEYNWNTSDYTDGEVTIYVISYDTSDNTTVTQPIVIKLDNLGSYPSLSDIYPIIFEDNSFNISWSKNNNDDFQSYTLYESSLEDMSDQTDIFTSTTLTDTSFIVESVEKSLYRYYQVVVNDTIGFSTKSNIVEGNSWKRFVMVYNSGNGERGEDIQLTDEGGYIISGSIDYGTGYDTKLWLLKTDSDGYKEWDRTWNGGVWGEDGSGYVTGKSVIQSNDGGFVVLGNNYDGSEVYESDEIWLIKTDQNGNEEWNKIFGENHQVSGSRVRQTNDDGYVVLGTLGYNDTGFDPVDTLNYIWLIKTGSNGNEQWNKMFGDGLSYIRGMDVQQTNDGGYIIIGSYLNNECLVYKTDSDGNQEWSRLMGGNLCHSIQKTDDGNFIVLGHVDNYQTSLTKLRNYGSGSDEWNKVISSESPTDLQYSHWSLQKTLDGNYVIFGRTITKFDELGNILLVNDSYITNSLILSGVPTSDGGYIIINNGTTNGLSNYFLRLMKTDSKGNTIPGFEW